MAEPPTQPTSMTVEEAYKRAVGSHQAGGLAQAEELCRRIMAVQPRHFGAMHLLGLCLKQSGDAAAAIQWLGSALQINPAAAFAHNNLGNALQDAGRFEEALASYDQAIARKPDYADAYSNRGSARQELGRFEEALADYDQAISLKPGAAAAHINRGVVLRELHRLDDALASLDRAAALQPDLLALFLNRGVILGEAKRFDEALACFDRVIALRPDAADGHLKRGIVLQAMRRFEEALASFDQALARKPDATEAWVNHGNALRELRRFDAAFASFDRAIALKPDSVDAHLSRGNAYQELLRLDAALASYEQVTALRPEHATANWNKAFLYLLRGDFGNGWPLYEWRWQVKAPRPVPPGYGRPLWLGEQDLAGRTILLQAEQGLGDTLQFCRYVPRVAETGAEVILEVQASVKTLLASMPGVRAVYARGEPLPEFDLQCPLLSLPLAFKTDLSSIPAEVPYLRPDPARVGHWREALGARRAAWRVGLAWCGSTIHRNDHNRSLALDRLRELMRTADVEFVSLQKDLRDEDLETIRAGAELRHFGEALGDFSDTAALLSLMDLVISVDTSVAHLAGALGKPVWIMLPFLPDWRWLLEREDSPWYPTARLYRQGEIGDWDGVVARVVDDLQRRVADHPAAAGAGGSPGSTPRPTRS